MAQVIGNPVTIPFKLIDSRPFIEVEVNGFKGMFIVDTGGRHGFNSDFANRAGIVLSDSFRISGAGNGTQWAFYGEEVGINLTDTDLITTTNRPIILNLNMIKDSLMLPFLDGIIGEELFRSFNVSINYPDRLITLYDKTFTPEGYEMIPFSFFRNQIPMISLTVDGKKGDFTIDTGDRSTLTVFSEFFEEELSGHEYELTDLKVTGYGVGGPIVAKEFKVKEVLLGRNHKMISVKARVPDHSEGSWVINDHAGNIGSAFLKDYEVIFDYSNKHILLKKTPSLTIPIFTYNTTNFDSTVAWYEKHFPFEKISSSDTTATLQFQYAKIQFVKNDKLPTLSAYKVNRNNKQPNGVFKFGIDIPNVQQLYNELLPKPDVLLMGRLINFWGTNMFLVRDPEGNVLQFFEGGSFWENTFYALITNSEAEYSDFIDYLDNLRMVEHSNFNNDSTGVKQQNFNKGNVKIELLKLDRMAEQAYNGIGASGIRSQDAIKSIQIKSIPPLRHHSAATYDFKNQNIIVFGGTSLDGWIGLNDVWNLTAQTGWKTLETLGSPKSRSSHMLFTSPSTESIYLFGGWDNNQILSDFWKLERGQWELIGLDTPLGSRYSSGHAYDKRSGQHVFYGGCTKNQGNLADTWLFKNERWKMVTKESSPGARCRTQLAYDEVNQKVLLFGGSGGAQTTWFFEKDKWKQVADEGPSSRYNHMMVSDTKRKKIILYGGASKGGKRFNDLWEWNGKAWEEIDFDYGPTQRDMGVMIYNESDGLVYLIGGRTQDWNPINDLWTWNGSIWNRIY